ncbi:hypothetical protein GMES_4426 [Paraglaciecola mesophila KMM 241]|uniref:Uncharacterized protein n=1 Tax=Paraglaciecola mesophila KMM 241 TaxID=1128912 RepID=K6Z8I0_9ALTE|nr:hypothetical protein GMES_4426 [Paraglaciecola mesophila KMM 241]
MTLNIYQPLHHLRPVILSMPVTLRWDWLNARRVIVNIILKMFHPAPSVSDSLIAIK